MKGTDVKRIDLLSVASVESLTSTASDSESPGEANKKKKTWNAVVRTASNLKHIMSKKDTTDEQPY